MKVGLLSKASEFAGKMLERLRGAGTGDEFLAWTVGEAAPAGDLEVLLTMGAAGVEEFAGQPRLGLVQTLSAGYDGIDVEAATAAGIWVSYAPSERTGNGVSVAEFAVMLLLAAARPLRQGLEFAAYRGAARPEMGGALSGKTVCIVGMGAIGGLIAERLRPFGVTLTGVNANPEKVPDGVKVYTMEELTTALGEADLVVIAIRGTKENENLFDAGMFRAMKRGAVLVNVARGSLVDEEALLGAIRSGHLGGAGLDVVKNEPVAPNDPLMGVPEIFVTPHVAGMTDLMLEGTAGYVLEVLRMYEAGMKTESLVNSPERPRSALANSAS